MLSKPGGRPSSRQEARVRQVLSAIQQREQIEIHLERATLVKGAKKLGSDGLAAWMHASLDGQMDGWLDGWMAESMQRMEG